MRLLLSAPISSSTIVLGKFFVSCFALMITLLLSSTYIFYLFFYGNPDFGTVISSYIGLYLLICSQTAFGLWVSSLTEKPILAFLFTLFGLFFFVIINFFTPIIESNTALHSVVRYLGYQEHLNNLFNGLIRVSDISYFLVFTACFLAFATTSTERQRWR